MSCDISHDPDTSEDFLNLVKCSYLNSDLWNNITERLRKVSTTEVSFTDSASLVQRLSLSPLSDVRSLAKIFESREPTLWKCFTLAEDDSICMMFVAKFFCSSSSCVADSGWTVDDTTQKKIGQQQFVLPIVLMQCNQAHVMDVDPARPDIPTLLPDSHTHMVLTTNQIPDFGSLTLISTQLSTVHKSSYLNTLHAALLQNITVQPQDFQAALEICNQTVLSIDVTPLIAGLCSHSFTKLLSDHDTSAIVGCGAPLSTEVLCELLTAVQSKKTGSCTVSLREADEGDSDDDDKKDVSKCDLIYSEINQAFSRYLSEFGFSAVPQCPAHFWLNERAAAASGLSGGEGVRGTVEEEGEDSGSVDTGKERGWSGSSGGTTTGQVIVEMILILFNYIFPFFVF